MVEAAGEGEDWPVVSFNETLSTFMKVESQIEILRKRVAKQSELIMKLQDTDRTVTSQTVVVDHHEEEEAHLKAAIDAITEKCGTKFKDLERRMDESDARVDNSNSRIDNCDHEDKMIRKDLLDLTNRVAEVEKSLAIVIDENKTAIVELWNEVNDGLGPRIGQLEKHKTDVDSRLVGLENDLTSFKVETHDVQHATREFENKLEHKVHHASGLIEALDSKFDEMENTVHLQGKKTVKLEHEIGHVKGIVDADHDKVKHLEINKADVEELHKKADRHDVKMKAEVSRVAELEEEVQVLTRKLAHTESSLQAEFERSEKSVDKRLDGILSSMIKLVKREVKRMMGDFQGIADIGKAGAARNRCLVCDQPVKMQTRESPAQLPKEPNHMPTLHVTHMPKQKVFKPDVRHDSSPPRVHLDRETLDSLADPNQRKDYPGVFGPPASSSSRPTVSEPDPGLITQIPTVKKNRPKTAGVSRSSSEKFVVAAADPPKGIVYDNEEYEREYISSVIAGRQVHVGDIVSAHSNTVRLIDVIGGDNDNKHQSSAGDLMGWKGAGRPGSAPATRRPGPVIPPKRA